MSGKNNLNRISIKSHSGIIRTFGAILGFLARAVSGLQHPIVMLEVPRRRADSLPHCKPSHAAWPQRTLSVTMQSCKISARMSPVPNLPHLLELVQPSLGSTFTKELSIVL